MAQLRRRAGFALEAKTLLLVRALGRQHLDRHPPLQPRVIGEIHHTHATPAKFPLHPVVSDLTGHDVDVHDAATAAGIGRR